MRCTVIWIFVLCAILIITSAILSIKILLIYKSIKEIRRGFLEKLEDDTNTLISISSTDKAICALANDINIQLRKLRKQQLRFQLGDTEIKNAVTNISHDLRTPLASICGNLDLLEQEELSEAASRYTEVIRNRSEVLTQLTEELFRYSVIMTAESDGIKEPVIINNVLEECIAASYTALTERNIFPDIQMPQEKIIRNLDRSALARVFSNLLNNAVKYSDGDLKITLYQTGEIIFSNTASGLTEVQVGKLFDRFYTVETARKSTGLGLAITRTLVEQMKGTIYANYKNSILSICILFPDMKI
ncbi:MAG: HAMP domain-containing histidine kinase [Lachnospiraceae bacterium]|nr:HAMP domain-containing histidine kinase [Lachnospiraceae bacterium]